MEEENKDETLDYDKDFAAPLATSSMIEQDQDDQAPNKETAVNIVFDPPPAPPPPIGPIQDLDKIITETLDIVHSQQEQISQQKHNLSNFAYILDRLRESLRLYYEHIEKLNSFLVTNDLLQSEYYYQYCVQLPTYGDYAAALEKSPEKIEVDEVKGPVSGAELQKLVDDVINNFYAGGAHVKTQRFLCKDINSKLERRQDFCVEVAPRFARWFNFINVQMGNMNVFANDLFEIAAYIDFLKTGENKEPLTLNIVPGFGNRAEPGEK